MSNNDDLTAVCPVQFNIEFAPYGFGHVLRLSLINNSDELVEGKVTCKNNWLPPIVMGSKYQVDARSAQPIAHYLMDQMQYKTCKLESCYVSDISDDDANLHCLEMIAFSEPRGNSAFYVINNADYSINVLILCESTSGDRFYVSSTLNAGDKQPMPYAPTYGDLHESEELLPGLYDKGVYWFNPLAEYCTISCDGTHSDEGDVVPQNYPTEESYPYNQGYPGNAYDTEYPQY